MEVINPKYPNGEAVGRELPDNIVNDLSSKQLSTYYRVVIEGAENIYLSTHSINFEGNYYKPILLKKPTIKQSVNLEDGKFKISTLTLSVSNFEYNGEIFSDILKDTPLINVKVTIYLNTQTSNADDQSIQLHVGQIRKVSHSSSTVTITAEDYTQQKLNVQLPRETTQTPDAYVAYAEKYRGKPIPFVYGHVDKAPAIIEADIIKADYDETVDLVTNESGDYEDIGDNFYYSNVQSDVFDNEIIHPFWIYSGNGYANIMIEGKQDLPQTRAALGFDALNITDTMIGNEQWYQYSRGRISIKTNQFSKFGVLQGNCFGKSSKISLTKRTSAIAHLGDGDSGFDNPDNFGEKINRVVSDGSYDFVDIYDANGSEPFHQWDYDYFNYPFTTVTQNLMRLRVETKPDYNGYGFNSQIAINGRRLPFLKPVTNTRNPLHVIARSGMAQLGDGSLLANINAVTLDGQDASIHSSLVYNFDASEFQFDKIFGFDNLAYDTSNNYYGLRPNDPNFDNLIKIQDVDLSGGGVHDSLLSPYIPYLLLWNSPDSGYFDIYFGMNAIITESGNKGVRRFEQTLAGRVSEIDTKSVMDIKDALTSNIYLNIDGRKNASGNRLVDALDILRDIAINEMNLTDEDIDETSFELAKTYVNLNLAFSVNEFIDGKALLEEVSQSTMCYPYFNSNGKLKFPTPYGDLSSTNAFYMNNNDIVSYSFFKSPSEKVYTRVDVKYKYDYETNEYLSSVSKGYGETSLEGITPLSMSDPVLEYYGYEDVEENVLLYESKYIRDLENARKLADRLFHYHRNQHLKIKLRLPLKWVGIEVGNKLLFEDLIENKLAFGLDYTQIEEIGEQLTTPLFFVTSVNISGDFIDVEATQMHFHANWTMANYNQAYDLIYSPEVENQLEEEVVEEDVNLPSLQVSVTSQNTNQNFIIQSNQAISQFPEAAQQINHWFESQAYGLDSFDSLAPTEWSSFSSSSIRNYEAIKLTIKVDAEQQAGGFKYYECILKNISGSSLPENFEFGWEFSGYNPQGTYLDSELYGYVTSEPIYGGWNIIHSLTMQDGLKKSIDENLIDVESIIFEPLFDGRLTQELGYEIGDANQDLNLNILDIVVLVNHILTSNNQIPDEYKYLGDFNEDGHISILDIVSLANYIMED